MLDSFFRWFPIASALVVVINHYFSDRIMKLETFDSKLEWREQGLQRKFAGAVACFLREITFGVGIAEQSSEAYLSFVGAEQEHWYMIGEVKKKKQRYHFWYKIPLAFIVLMLVVFLFFMLGDCLEFKFMAAQAFKVIVWSIFVFSITLLFISYCKLAQYSKWLKDDK